jgi:hypothetical protein
MWSVTEETTAAEAGVREYYPCFATEQRLLETNYHKALTLVVQKTFWY